MDARGGGRGRLALDDARSFVLDEDRDDDIVDEDAVELGRQQTNGRQHNRQREPEQCLGFIGLDIGKQPPEGLGLAEAVGADFGAGAEGAAAGGAVFYYLDRIDMQRLVPFGIFFLDQACALNGLGYAGEFVVLTLRKSQQLDGLILQLDDEGTAAHVVAGLDALHFVQAEAHGLGRICAIGVEDEYPLVGERKPRVAVLPVGANVGGE